jgi:hypothetical protein
MVNESDCMQAAGGTPVNASTLVSIAGQRDIVAVLGVAEVTHAGITSFEVRRTYLDWEFRLIDYCP